MSVILWHRSILLLACTFFWELISLFSPTQGCAEAVSRDIATVAAQQERGASGDSDALARSGSRTWEDRTLDRTGRKTLPDIIMHYPAFGTADVDRDIAAWTGHIALTFERDFASSWSQPDDGGTEDEEYNVAWLNATYTVHEASPTCVSVVFDVWMHTGGSFLNEDVLTLNYNMTTGQRLHIVDIFENVDTALRILSDVSRRELAQGAGGLMWSDIQDGTIPVPENFSSIALTRSGITVYFQPFQVTRLPKAFKVEVPLDVLLPAGPLLTLWGRS